MTGGLPGHPAGRPGLQIPLFRAPAACWLDLRGPDHDDLAVLSEEFGLHPLAVEAALHHSQRPKLDRYRSHLFLTAYGARLDPGTGELTTSEIAAFITSQALITVRKDDGLDIDAVVRALGRKPRPRQIRGRLPAVRAAGLHRRWPVRGGPEPG